ncbi:MAG: hypothetical protein M1134_06315 [Actinobacteria bacterium]|nr:hypothetical protein [Actinomycetota bacterium]MCL5445507.1 hypothetical protein [Actinomycetota bacterium]
MVDGHGDPNTSTGYRDAIEALYTLPKVLSSWDNENFSEAGAASSM